MNEIVKQIKKGGGRNHAIDLMKFFAAILITNSHMAALYPNRFSRLAAGGAIGDSLFFFCSGFCLMLGSNSDFFNWYKRRINRIFPTIFAVALVGIVFMAKDPTLKHVIVKGGGWFVQAIFLFYAVFWFVKRFLADKLWVAFVMDAIIVLVWFIWFWDKSVFILFNGTYIRWPVYFMVMLMGAAASSSMRKQDEDGKERSGWFYLGLLVVTLVFYYGYQLVWYRYPILKDFQIILVPALLGMIYAFFKLCSNKKVIKVYQSKHLNWVMYGISACCLEIYLSGNWSFGIGLKLIHLFPLNIIVTFMIIFIVAYLVKVFSNFLSQTFKTEKYDWKGMVKL